MILGPLRSPEAEAISASMLSETLQFWGTRSPSVGTNKNFAERIFYNLRNSHIFLAQSVKLVGRVEKTTFLRTFCSNKK